MYSRFWPLVGRGRGLVLSWGFFGRFLGSDGGDFGPVRGRFRKELWGCLSVYSGAIGAFWRFFYCKRLKNRRLQKRNEWCVLVRFAPKMVRFFEPTPTFRGTRGSGERGGDSSKSTAFFFCLGSVVGRSGGVVFGRFEVDFDAKSGEG